MSSNYYKAGSHNIICDLCGKKWKREQMRKTWNSFMACPNDWYPKPKNELPRVVHTDARPVRDARPRHTTGGSGFVPLNRWLDPGLRWLDPNFRWDGNPGNGALFVAGQYLTATIPDTNTNEQGGD